MQLVSHSTEMIQIWKGSRVNGSLHLLSASTEMEMSGQGHEDHLAPLASRKHCRSPCTSSADMPESNCSLPTRPFCARIECPLSSWYPIGRSVIFWQANYVSHVRGNLGVRGTSLRLFPRKHAWRWKSALNTLPRC